MAYSIADSRVGKAIWIYEKFHDWSDDRDVSGQGPALDRMLEDISVYWFINTGASSERICWKNWPHGPLSREGTDIDLPTTVTIFPRDFYCTLKA